MDVQTSLAVKARNTPKAGFKYRPHNLELRQFEQLVENYRTMLNLGFLNQTIVHQNFGRLLNVP